MESLPKPAVSPLARTPLGPGADDGMESAEENSRSWSASLECTLVRRPGRTVLSSRRHRGPLLVQRPFYPEADGRCHLYVVHPPGGVAGGDHLSQRFIAETGSTVLLTTPSASKFYRSSGRWAAQETRFILSPESQVEWLPQESIFFSGAQVMLKTHVELQGSARFLGWDIVALGRPASGEAFTSGQLRQRLELYRDGHPLLLERADFRGADPMLTASWGMAGMPVSATLVCTSDHPSALVAAARANRPKAPTPALHAATALPGLALYRYLGPWALAAQRVFEHIWRLWRPLAFATAACPPRIWST